MKYIFKDSCIGVSIFRQAGAAPTITLVSVVDITDSTANVNVSIADGEGVSKTGVEIDTDPSFSNPTQYEENGAVNTIAIDNLDAETTYYVRAYVIWSGQTIYSSNSLNFTTTHTSILPAELQGVEYLQTDGNAYINLGIKLDTYDTLECVAIVPSGASKGIFGARTTNAIRAFYTNRTASGFLRFSVNHNGSNYADYNNIAEVEVKFYQNLKNFYIYYNNEIVAQNTSTQNTTTEYDAYLFAYNNEGVISSILNGLKIKRFIYKNQINLYPCYIKAGQTFVDNKGNTCTAGTCGMYDVVNHVFYTNDGTGTFSKGADINI